MGPLILSELLFDENIRDQIKKYKRHFLRVLFQNNTSSNFKSDRWDAHDLHVQDYRNWNTPVTYLIFASILIHFTPRIWQILPQN